MSDNPNEEDVPQFRSLREIFEYRKKKSEESPRLWNINYENVIRIEVSFGAALSGGVYLDVDCVAGEAHRNHEEDPIKLDIKSFARELCDIVAIWEKEMVNHGILDGTYYYVKLKCREGNYEFSGQNKFPYNFERFTSLLRCANIIN